MHLLAFAPLLLLAAAPPADEKSFMVSDFDRVRIDGPFEVEIVTGSPGARASGDPQALDHVAIRVEGSTLTVNAGATGWALRAVEAPGTVKITISVPALSGLSIRGGAQVSAAEMRSARVDLGLSGAGSIAVSAVRADDLVVTLAGAGAITLAGTAARARVNSFGDGSVHAENLVANEAALFGASTGEVQMRVRYAAQVSARGTGKVTVLGQPSCKVTGSGPVECGQR
jgi:putative autotransporter adhesin-like protein